MYVNNNTSETILSVNFRLFGENFITSFIQPEIKQQTMAEVCGVGLKNLRANFRVEELFSARNVSRYFPCRKTLAISIPNRIILCSCFEHLLVYLYDLDVFFTCARNSDEYFTKFIVNRFLNFSPASFLQYCQLAKSSK